MAQEKSLRLAYDCASLHNLPEKGSPVIMLHGLTDSKKTWEDIYQTISSVTNRRVYIYDARNHGDSEWSDTFNIDVLAEDLGNFMRDMKIEKAALVGHSLGGMTAMRFAFNNPSKVEKLFIEDISPFDFPKKAMEQVQIIMSVLLQSVTAIPNDADEETAIQHVVGFFRKLVANIDEEMLEYLSRKAQIVQRNGVWQWKANMKVFAKSLKDRETFYGKIEGKYDGPALFIYGTASEFEVGDQKDDIKKLIPNAEFFAVEGGSHMIHPKHPEFMKELTKFLK